MILTWALQVRLVSASTPSDFSAFETRPSGGKAHRCGRSSNNSGWLQVRSVATQGAVRGHMPPDEGSTSDSDPRSGLSKRLSSQVGGGSPAATGLTQGFSLPDWLIYTRVERSQLQADRHRRFAQIRLRWAGQRWHRNAGLQPG